MRYKLWEQVCKVYRENVQGVIILSCRYCDGSKRIYSTCDKCYGHSDKDTHDSIYAWHCDKCHGEGYIEVECGYCKNN